MKKIVVNDAFGSCYLSLDALYLLHQLGFPLTVQPMSEMHLTEADHDVVGPDGFHGVVGDYSTALLKDGQVHYFAWGNRSPEAQALRSHPALVKMAEVLGNRATRGRFGRLRIEEIADDVLYRIKDYDGAEGVEIYSSDGYVAGQAYVEPNAPVVPAEGWFAA